MVQSIRLWTVQQKKWTHVCPPAHTKLLLIYIYALYGYCSDLEIIFHWDFWRQPQTLQATPQCQPPVLVFSNAPSLNDRSQAWHLQSLVKTKKVGCHFYNLAWIILTACMRNSVITWCVYPARVHYWEVDTGVSFSKLFCHHYLLSLKQPKLNYPSVSNILNITLL